jgi:hypothetical protein
VESTLIEVELIIKVAGIEFNVIKFTTTEFTLGGSNGGLRGSLLLENLSLVLKIVLLALESLVHLHEVFTLVAELGNFTSQTVFLFRKIPVLLLESSSGFLELVVFVF